MKSALKVLAWILIAIVIATTAASAAFIAIGALIARWLPMTLFQAAALGIGSALVMLLSAYLIATLMHYHAFNPWHHRCEDWEPEDDEEESEDDQDEFLNATIKNDSPKIGRNAPCPCGSGRKFKHCCGRLQHRA